MTEKLYNNKVIKKKHFKIYGGQNSCNIEVEP